MVFIIDENKKILYANSKCDKIFDFDINSYVNNSSFDIFCRAITCQNSGKVCPGCRFDKAIRQLLANNSDDNIVEEVYFISESGLVRYFKASLSLLNTPEGKYILVALDNITEEKELYKRLEQKHFKLKLLTESLERADSIVISVANAVEAKDKMTKGHVSRVSYYSEKIGQYFNLSESELETLKRGAILHDIGKIGTPDSILNKPGPLTPEEFEIMKRHPVDGYKILSSLKSFKDIASIVRHHHEKLDGSGYPDGLKGDEIDLLTRIVAIIDIYDALIAERSYKKAFTREQALEIIFKDVEAGKLDRDVALALEKVTAESSPVVFSPTLHL